MGRQPTGTVAADSVYYLLTGCAKKQACYIFAAALSTTSQFS